MQGNKNQLSSLKGRIFNKSKEGNIIDSYHYLMVHYGYIPFEDFKKMDAFLVDELISRLNKMNEESNKGGTKGRVGRRMR